MTRLTWDDVGTRLYESGVDRGVLYVSGIGYGVPWDGLVSVTEQPSGGQAKSVYIDGEKVSHDSAPEEFTGSIEAFSSPTDFAVCDGQALMGAGVYVDNQPRRHFSLTYRTKIGSDSLGLSYGYKIHLVYNALVNPTSKKHTTVGQNPTPNLYNWPFSTKPVRIQGARASAHMVIDSTKTPQSKVEELEDLLYGTPSTPARMPTVSELLALML